MIKEIRGDIASFINAYKGQGSIFYFGCAYIVFTYLRPHLIYPQLNFLPWLQLTILGGLGLMAFKKQLNFTGTHALVFLFAILAWISALTSYYPDISMLNIDTPVIWAIEVLFLSNCVSNLKQLKLLISLLLLFLFKMSFFGAKTWALRGFGFSGWGIQGPPGYFNNSGEFSLLMAMTAVMSIPFLIGLGLKRRYLWLLPITAVMTVLGASSRGGQLALVVGLLYLLIAYKKIRIKNLVYTVLAGWLIMTILPEEQKARLSSMGDDDTSVSRMNYWHAGIDMAKQNPWTGVGYNAFPDYYNDYYKIGGEGYLSNRKEVSHNSMVQVVSTMGIPALLIYLMIHIRIFYNTPKKSLRLAADHSPLPLSIYHSLRGGIVTFFIGAFFMSVAFYPYIYLLCGLSIALRRLTEKLKNGNKHQPILH